MPSHILSSRWSTASLVALLLSGCAPEVVDPCGSGGAPSLEECEQRTTVSADCGGEGGPVLACSRRGECRWFAGACVAEGFEATPCAADDVCCLEGYPFDASWKDPTPEDSSVFDFLFGFGTSPWDVARATTLDVALDPSLAASTPTMACTEAAPGGPCDELRDARRGLDGSLVVWLSGPANLSGWHLWLEASRDVDGALVARTCRVPFVDGVFYACDYASEPECASSGQLELSAWPEDDASLASLALHLTASFPSGGSIDLTL